MKKLLVILGAFACAASLQAATYSWANAYSVSAYGKPGPSGSTQNSGTMYLINAATVIGENENARALTQAYFVETVLAAGAGYESAFNTLVASAVNSGTMTSGGLNFGSAASGTIDSGKVIFGTADAAGTPMTFYQVLLDTENNGLYISEAIETTVEMSTTYLDFLNDGSYDGAGVGTNPFPAGTTTFVSDGWYTAAPEPTSGLLLLFGLAGLALKRKRV